MGGWAELGFQVAEEAKGRRLQGALGAQLCRVPRGGPATGDAGLSITAQLVRVYTHAIAASRGLLNCLLARSVVLPSHSLSVSLAHVAYAGPLLLCG